MVENIVNPADSLIKSTRVVAARNKGQQVRVAPDPATAADAGANRRVVEPAVKPSHGLAN
eukprot:11756362-Alexandrium_andersonii.AAC.1